MNNINFNLKKNICFNKQSYIKIRYYDKINSRNFSDIFKTEKYLKYLNNIFLNNIYYLGSDNYSKKMISDLELLFEAMYFMNSDSNMFLINIWKNIPSYSRFILILFLNNLKINCLIKKYDINLNYIFEHLNCKIDYSFLKNINIFLNKKRIIILRKKINKVLIFKIKICSVKNKMSFKINNKILFFNKYLLKNNRNVKIKCLVNVYRILNKNNLNILNILTLSDYLNLTDFEIKNLQIILFQKKKLIYNLTILQNNAFITLFDYMTSHVYFVRSTSQLGFTGRGCCSKYALSILLKIGFSQISSFNFKNSIKFKLVLSPFINNIYYITYYFKEILDYLQILNENSENDSLDINFKLINENENFYFQKINCNNIIKSVNRIYSGILYISTLPVFNGCRSRKIRKKKIRYNLYSSLIGTYYYKLNKNNLFK